MHPFSPAVQLTPPVPPVPALVLVPAVGSVVLVGSVGLVPPLVLGFVPPEVESLDEFVPVPPFGSGTQISDEHSSPGSQAPPPVHVQP
jgi:hypothetical protein